MTSFGFDKEGEEEFRRQMASLSLGKNFTDFFTKFPEFAASRDDVLKISRRSIELTFSKMFETGGKINISILIASGLNSRIFTIFEGIISEMSEDRTSTSTILIRAQIENIAVAHKLSRDPSYAQKLYAGKRGNITSLVDLVSKKYNGLREDYNAYSEFAHPNERAMYQNFKPTDKHRTFTFSNSGVGFKSKEDKENFFKSLIVWTGWAQDELESFIKSIRVLDSNSP